MEMESMEAEQSEMAPIKLTKEEEEYLDRLLAEKKILELTTGVDFTQKLINAGESKTNLKKKNKKQHQIE